MGAVLSDTSSFTLFSSLSSFMLSLQHPSRGLGEYFTIFDNQLIFSIEEQLIFSPPNVESLHYSGDVSSCLLSLFDLSRCEELQEWIRSVLGYDVLRFTRKELGRAKVGHSSNNRERDEKPTQR